MEKQYLKQRFLIYTIYMSKAIFYYTINTKGKKKRAMHPPPLIPKLIFRPVYSPSTTTENVSG